MKTIFEQIIERTIPAHIVYEDELVIAFLDITQATVGHTLVVTKTPYPSIFEVPESVISHLFLVVKKLSTGLQKAFNLEGLNILNNNGSVAGQTVFHYHVHLIPRYQKDEVQFKLENNMGKLEPDSYKKRAAMIIAALS